jgi:hypothetical protein
MHLKGGANSLFVGVSTVTGTSWSLDSSAKTRIEPQTAYSSVLLNPVRGGGAQIRWEFLFKTPAGQTVN